MWLSPLLFVRKKSDREKYGTHLFCAKIQRHRENSFLDSCPHPIEKKYCLSCSRRALFTHKPDPLLFFRVLRINFHSKYRFTPIVLARPKRSNARRRRTCSLFSWLYFWLSRSDLFLHGLTAAGGVITQVAVSDWWWLSW
jgi:hypothetical protein